MPTAPGIVDITIEKSWVSGGRSVCKNAVKIHFSMFFRFYFSTVENVKSSEMSGCRHKWIFLNFYGGKVENEIERIVRITKISIDIVFYFSTVENLKLSEMSGFRHVYIVYLYIQVRLYLCIQAQLYIIH